MGEIIVVSFWAGSTLFVLVAYILIYVINARVAHVRRELDSLHHKVDRYLLATGQELGWLDLADGLQEQVKEAVIESGVEATAVPRIRQLLRCEEQQARRMYREVYQFLAETEQLAGGDAMAQTTGT